jgi:hypothetical protein
MESYVTVTFDQRILVPEDVLVQELEGESVLLNLKSERYFGLDEVGTRMWAVLSNSESIQQAYDVLLGEYEVEPHVLRRDLLNLIDRLIEHGLVEIGNAQVA